jgi:hypothetical protein
MTTDDNNMNIRIEQYKICVTSVEKHSEQRIKVNNFFLGINTSLVIAFNYLNQPDHNSLNKYLWMILSSGIIASLLWFVNLYTYRNIAREKYNSIKKIEQDLPYKPFTESWDAIKNPDHCLKKLFGHKAYSKIEMCIPFFFIFLYLCMIFDFFNLHIYYGNP